ncbi:MULTISPECIES: transketolase family protein [Enterobacteriaceae]|uniref:Transketolase n=1 Tax=Lelliottia nimipressuralis TaxID=69220 RepID=A0ABD4K443_9ENTR|nr:MULTISPECIES: transketolase [Enterobacteriaceae]MBF4176491.1 transketolase [Lelliottia nimipressuralis]MDU4003231.1 transketolase [Pluralibacter gergoviae]
MKKVLTWDQRFAEINAMRQRFAVVMSDLIREKDNVALVLADITAERFSDVLRDFPDRVINTGIREQLMIDMAGGLALSGMRPFAHTFASFLIERPFEQIKISLNHQNVGAVLVSAGASYDLSVDGRTHQSPADVALLNTLADWKIIVPGNAEEAEYALRIAANDTGLYYIRLSTETNKQTYWSGENSFTVLRTGHQGTVIAVGPVTDRVLEATEDLDITVLYAPVISPFDSVTLRNTLSVPDIAIVEPYLEGTTAHTISESLSDVSHRILSIGVKRQELRQFGTPEEHIQAHGLDTHGLRERLSRFYRH